MKKIIIIALCFVASISCNKTDIVQESSSNKLVFDKLLKVTNSDPDFLNVMESSQFLEAIKTFGLINLNEVTAIKFVNSSIKGFMIPFKNNSFGDEKFLTATLSNNEVYKITILHREVSKIADYQNMTGEFSILESDGTLIMSETYNKGVLVANRVGIERDEMTNVRISKCTCSYATFNKEYQRLKNDCSNDWICDTACLFQLNPFCWALFTATSLGGCISCWY